MQICPKKNSVMMTEPRAVLAGVDAVSGQHWYEIRAQAEERHAEIYLYDVIGGWGISAQQFLRDCKEAGVYQAATIDLHIHSPGGDVLQGFAIYNTLAGLSARITIYIDGMAASMASMIACLPGAQVHMPENAWLMIHKPLPVPQISPGPKCQRRQTKNTEPAAVFTVIKDREIGVRGLLLPDVIL